MIEFKVDLANGAEKYFRKQMAKWSICRLTFFWVLCFPILFFQFRFLLGDKFPLAGVFFGGIIIGFSVSLIVCFKTNLFRVIKVTINNGRITYFMNNNSQSFNLNKVKAVYEFEKFYCMKTRFWQFCIPLVCQKDQLVTGSIEEFEEMFKDKIVKKG